MGRVCWRCVSSSDETETVSVSELCGIDTGCCDAMAAIVLLCAEMPARSMYQEHKCTDDPGPPD